MKNKMVPLAVNIFTAKGNRPAQEDHLLIAEKKGIYVVADGFGGPEPGYQAAKTACDSVYDFLSREGGDEDATLPFELRSYFSLSGNILFNAFMHANEKVNRMNDERDVHERGGASVIGGFLDGNLLSIANVGACSAWLFRGQSYQRLILPKTYERMVDPTQLANQNGNDVPLMSLGTAAHLEPEITEVILQKGDWVLMHTDGLVEDRIEEVMTLRATNDRLDKLVERADLLFKSIQFMDNISLSLIIF